MSLLSTKSVQNRFIRNGLAAVLQKGIRVLDQLLLVPFFLSAWGAEYYGEWLTLMVIPTVLGFSDMGFGTAAANTFVLRYASGDRMGAANIAASGLFSVSIVVVVGFIFSIGLGVCGEDFGIFSNGLIPQQESLTAVALMMAARVTVFYQQLFESYFSAARRTDISINLQTFFSIFSLTFSILVLKSDKGLVFFSAVYFGWVVMFTVLYAIIARKILEIHKLGIGKIFYKDIKEIFHKGIGYLLSPVWQAIFFQGTTLVVMSVLGPVAVTIFNTVRTVTRATNQIYSMVINSTLSEMQHEVGSGNLDRARRIFRVSLTVILIIAVVGILSLLVGGEWLYGMWTKNTLNPPTAMWYVFIIGIAFNAVWWPASFVFQVMNRPYEFAIAGVICATVSVMMSFILTKSYGLTGAAVGSVLMDMLLFIYIFPRACKMLNQSILNLPKETILDFVHIKRN